MTTPGHDRIDETQWSGRFIRQLNDNYPEREIDLTIDMSAMLESNYPPGNSIW
jgi:hypothetical protein